MTWTRQRIVLAVATAVGLAYAVYMSVETTGLDFLTLHLSHSAEELAGLLRQPEVRGRYVAGLGLDNIFLFLYPLQFLALVWFATARRTEAADQGWIWAARAAGAFMVAAAVFDFLENSRSIPLIEAVGRNPNGGFEMLRAAVRDASAGKWALLGVASAGMGIASKRLLPAESRNAACALCVLLTGSGLLYLTGSALEYFLRITGRAFIAAGFFAYLTAMLCVAYFYVVRPALWTLDRAVRAKLGI